MELIKKQLQQITTTATTTCDEGVVGPCYEVIVDTSISYNLKILLKDKNVDFGFFDVLIQEGDVPASVKQLLVVVTGSSSSRLSELRKFSNNGSISDLYFTSTDPSVEDGVNLSLTTSGVTWTYYIGGITYIDNISGNTTTFSFTSPSYGDDNNFANYPFIKDETKQNIIDQPEIDNNVFIIRQSLPVYENIYRLQNINTLSDLEKYAGGGKFNIVNNS